MQQDCLSKSAALVLGLRIEMLSSSRSMGTPNNLHAVQPLMIVAAIPVEAQAEYVRFSAFILAIMH